MTESVKKRNERSGLTTAEAEAVNEIDANESTITIEIFPDNYNLFPDDHNLLQYHIRVMLSGDSTSYLIWKYLFGGSFLSSSLVLCRTCLS